MGKTSNYASLFNRDYEKLWGENQHLKLENALLKDENRRLKLQLEKQKIAQDKDCTCSSIPSSKNNFKKGISNSRKKSENKPGAVNGHKPAFLSTKMVEELKANNSTKVVQRQINHTSKNKDKKPIIRYAIGYEIIPVVYEYLIYPNQDGKYEIPKDLRAPVSYAPELKTLAMELYYNCNVSTDHLSEFLKDIFSIKISKGTVINWSKELNRKLMPETGHILRCLLKEKYNHVDESQINVEGETYNIHNVSSNQYTMQWVHKNKSHKALEEIGFLLHYRGTLIKDGTHLYDKFGTEFVSCGAHINRYLIGANKGISHTGEERMIMFFEGLRRRRKALLKKGTHKVSCEEYANICIQYKFLLEEWKKEIKKDCLINPLYDEERKLQARLLSDMEQHLKFMTDFSLPYTNNRAETDIRGVKQRQKVGIFRNEEAAERYVTIRSCISTYKKNKVNIFDAIHAAFSGETIIV